MKKVISAMAIMIGFSVASNAQTSTAPMEKDGKKMEMNSDMKMKDGVMMMDNKMMMCSNEKCTPLTKPYKCTDGTMVAVNGSVTKSDGSTSMLMNGSQISMDGKMTMIAHGEKGHMCNDSCPMHSKMEMKTETKPDMKMEMKMKDGVMMMDNKMMMCSNEKCTPLTKPYKCTDGTMVAVNGTITKSDGSTSMLMNGSQISMDGKMTMIAHGQKGHMCTDSCPMHSKM